MIKYSNPTPVINLYFASNHCREIRSLFEISVQFPVSCSCVKKVAPSKFCLIFGARMLGLVKKFMFCLRRLKIEGTIIVNDNLVDLAAGIIVFFS